MVNYFFSPFFFASLFENTEVKEMEKTRLVQSNIYVSNNSAGGSVSDLMRLPPAGGRKNAAL